MRSISDVRLEEFENVAMESVKKLSEYFKYEGADPRYFQKARVASGMISAYARLRASETNRQAIELASSRVLSEIRDSPTTPKKLAR